MFRRLRDEAPLYYNEKYDFYAVSRFDDVERASVNWRTFISGKGSVLELIRSGIEMPPGNILFEDPPAHDVHRSLLARVFTPRRMADIEPKVREFCAAQSRPAWSAGAASTSSRTSARRCRCGPSACCWAFLRATSRLFGTGSTRASRWRTG